MPKTPPRPAPTPEDPRERILDAASSAFAEVGFAGARVDDIAARAGVNKAMLYYYVGDKRALYSAVLLRNLDRVTEAISGVLKEGDPARSRLVAAITAFARIMEEIPEHPRMVLREVASGAANLPPEVFSRMLEIVAIVAGLLSDGVAAGEFRRTEPVLTHFAIVGMVVFLHATSPLRQRGAELEHAVALPDSPTDLAAFVSDLLLEGIAAPPPRSPNS